MNHPNFFEWSQEEKDRYAAQKLREMRKKNAEIEKRHVVVKFDQRAAEYRNSSVTNAANAQKSGASSERCRPRRVDRNVSRYPREWDRGKESGDWEAHSPKAFKNYRTSDYERRNLRNETRTSARDDRNYRSDHVPDTKNKHYNKNQHNRYDGSSKQSWYQSSESSRKLQHQRDKNKKYFSSDTKHHNKHQSNSSSTDSEYMNDKWNKPRSSNAEASALWHSERLNEDKNKRERCIKWVEDSVHGSNFEQERIPTDEEEKANTSPKRKLEKFETTSDKCLNDNDVPSVGSSSRNKPKQSWNLKSRKLDCTDNKSSTKVAQKTQVLRKSCTKFDRINRSDHSSDDSDSNCNLESNKQDYTENDNNNLEKEHFKCNMKLENEPSEEKSLEETSAEEDKEPSHSERKFTESKSESKSFSYNPGSQFVKRSSDTQRYSPVRKVYPHDDGYVISREFTYSDRGCNEKDFKKGSKAKQNPQTIQPYNSPESCKNEHISKQRKFDKGQSKEPLNSKKCKGNRQYFVSSGNKNRSMKAEKCTSDKRSDFNVVQSLNQDDGNWGNIVQSQVEDEDGCWGNIVQSQVDDDDGIWASTDQSDIKWEINEDCNTKQKSAKKNYRGHDKKEAKAFKDNQRYSPVRKVYPHDDGYVISREFTYSDRGCNEKDFKKGSKAKQNPQTILPYNSPESCKNEHISKQRKFDKGQSKEPLNSKKCKGNRQYFVSSGNKNRSMKAEKCTSDKRSDFNVVQSLNQDDGNWGNIVQSQVEDEDGCWGNIVQSQVDDDDGIWASTDQSDIKWEINEDCNTKQKSAKKNYRGHDKKEAKAFKGKHAIGSDDGGWSTVEEGEIRSDDGFEESKEHVE